MIMLENLSSYKENNRLEAKKAVGGLPKSIWETYSSFANTNGGVILLGVEELADGSLSPVTLPNPEKLVTDFWNIINDRLKVNVNILSDKHVNILELYGKRIVVIEVPRANRTDKPVYIDNNPINGSYRRNWQGDYHCTKEEVSNMFRDQADVSQDTRVLEQLDLDAFDYDTVRRYRIRFDNTRPRHAWKAYDDVEFLIKLGCINRDENGKLCPTAAGVLMFGFDYEIEKEYSYYFLDYQEHDDETKRWTDRIYTSLGDWSGNIYDFYSRVSLRIEQLVKKPYVHDGEARIDETPVHKALNEALVNALIHANYYDRRGLVIHRRPESLVIANPGCLRLSADDAVYGGFSDPRNMTLVKMFNLINIGDRAGTGLSTIYSVWEDEGWIKPKLEEQFNPDRTIFTLSLMTSDMHVSEKSFDRKYGKNERTMSELLSELLSPNDYKKVLPIIEHLEKNKVITPKEAESLVNKSSATTRRYLGILTNVRVLAPEGKANKTIYNRII